MNIVVLSSYLPFPLLSGGQVRLYNLIKELSRKHDITLICEMRPNQTEKDIHEMQKICKKVIAIPRKKQWSLQNIAKAGSSSQSFLVSGHTQKRLQEAIRSELQRQTYDVIHVETYYVMQNLPETKIPVVLVEHNIEYSVYKKFAERVPAILRPLLSIDIAKIKKEEEHVWKKADALVAVSQDDAEVMKKTGVSPYIVSNGVNVGEFMYKDMKKELKKQERKILFIGDFSWVQNIDSVSFILKEVWPAFRKLLSDSEKEKISLWIVGRKIPEKIRALSSDPSIIFDEKSSSMTAPEIFQSASVLLAPIRVGGGTSYKILESMSCGTPVVTMQMSADAIGAKDNESIMIGHDASSLASKVHTLLNDNEKYETISKEGRKHIEENYTWKMIAQELDMVYRKVV